MAVVAILALGGGAYAALHARSRSGQPPVVVRSLCGDHASPEKENIVDELDSNVRPVLVHNVAERQFGSRVVAFVIRRAHCPSTFRGLIENLKPNEAKSFIESLRKTGKTDVSRVSLRSTSYDRQDVNSAHKQVDGILDRHPKAVVVTTQPLLQHGTVRVDARSIPRAVMREIRERVPVPVKFHIDPKLEPLLLDRTPIRKDNELRRFKEGLKGG